jgi:hypothetical protein
MLATRLAKSVARLLTQCPGARYCYLRHRSLFLGATARRFCHLADNLSAAFYRQAAISEACWLPFCHAVHMLP